MQRKIENNNYPTKNDVNDQKESELTQNLMTFKSSVSRICQFTLRFFLSINKMIELHKSAKKQPHPNILQPSSLFCRRDRRLKGKSIKF